MHVRINIMYLHSMWILLLCTCLPLHALWREMFCSPQAFALLRVTRRLSVPPWAPKGSVRYFSGRDLFTEFAGIFSANAPHVAVTMQTFQTIHDMTGLPWWGSIVVGGVFLRSIIGFPMHVINEVNTARVINIQPKMMEFRKTLTQKAANLPKDVSGKKKLKTMVIVLSSFYQCWFLIFIASLQWNFRRGHVMKSHIVSLYQ